MCRHKRTNKPRTLLNSLSGRDALLIAASAPKQPTTPFELFGPVGKIGL
jgi:hypothetical protein